MAAVSPSRNAHRSSDAALPCWLLCGFSSAAVLLLLLYLLALFDNGTPPQLLVVRNTAFWHLLRPLIAQPSPPPPPPANVWPADANVWPAETKRRPPPSVHVRQRQRTSPPPPCCDCSGVHRRSEWKRALGAVLQSAQRSRASTSRRSIQDCANLAPAGTGSRTLYKRLAQLQHSPRRAHHDHWRDAISLQAQGASCFLITLRDPAERWKTAWAFLEQHTGVYLPYGRQQQAPLKVLMRNFDLIPNRLVSSFPAAPGWIEPSNTDDILDERRRQRSGASLPNPKAHTIGQQVRSAIGRRLYYASNSAFDWHRRRGGSGELVGSQGAGIGKGASTARSADGALRVLRSTAATLNTTAWAREADSKDRAASHTRGERFFPPSPRQRGLSSVEDPAVLALADPRPTRAVTRALTSVGSKLEGYKAGGNAASKLAYESRRTLPPHELAGVWPEGFSWERKREPFLIAQIFYLATLLAAHPEIEVHVVCTNSFDEDWRHVVRRFGALGIGNTSGRAVELNALPRSDSSRAGTSKRAQAIRERINASDFFSYQAQQYVRRCLFPEDWILFRLLC